MFSHAACGIHPPAGGRRQFSTDPLWGRWTRPPREGSVQANFCSSQSSVWVHRCNHYSWAVALGGGVGFGVCGWIMETGGGGGPSEVLVVLCGGGAWEAGTWAYMDPWVGAHGLRFQVGLRSVVAAVAGHLLDVADIGGW